MLTPGSEALTHLTVDGRHAVAGRTASPSLPWLGVNFWSRAGGPRMWSDATTPRRARGARDARRPRPRRHALVLLLARFRARAGAARRRRRRALRRLPRRTPRDRDARRSRRSSSVTCPGENWDPPWRQRTGTCTATSGWSRSRRGSPPSSRAASGAIPSICGWLVSNEMPLYGGPATIDEVTAWARIVVQAIRSAGADQPVSLGDGAWGIEMTRR